MNTPPPKRRPISAYHLILYLLLGIDFLYLGLDHLRRQQTGQARLILSGSAFFFFLVLYSIWRGVPYSPFGKGEPFHFWSEWDWETPPPGWKDARNKLCFLACLFAIIGLLSPNPLTMIMGLPLSAWFFFQLCRLLRRVRACQNQTFNKKM